LPGQEKKKGGGPPDGKAKDTRNRSCFPGKKKKKTMILQLGRMREKGSAGAGEEKKKKKEPHRPFWKKDRSPSSPKAPFACCSMSLRLRKRS